MTNFFHLVSLIFRLEIRVFLFGVTTTFSTRVRIVGHFSRGAHAHAGPRQDREPGVGTDGNFFAILPLRLTVLKDYNNW